MRSVRQGPEIIALKLIALEDTHGARTGGGGEARDVEFVDACACVQCLCVRCLLSVRVRRRLCLCLGTAA